MASLDASVIEDVSSRSADGEVTAGDLQLTLVSDKIDRTYGSPRYSAPVDPKTAKNRALQTYKQIQMSSGRLIFPPRRIFI